MSRQAPIPLNFVGSEERLALDGTRVYVATDFPARLYILDITTSLAPLLLGAVELPTAVQNHAIAGIAVQGEFACVLTDERIMHCIATLGLVTPSTGLISLPVRPPPWERVGCSAVAMDWRLPLKMSYGMPTTRRCTPCIRSMLRRPWSWFPAP